GNGAIRDIEAGNNVLGGVPAHILPDARFEPSHRVSKILSPEALEAVKGVNSNRRLYFWGFVKYEDIFGDVWIREFKRAITIVDDVGVFAQNAHNENERRYRPSELS